MSIPPNIVSAQADIEALQKNYTKIFSNVEDENIEEVLSHCYIRTVVENGVEHLKLEKHRPWSFVDWLKRAWYSKEYTIATDSSTYKRLENLVQSLPQLSSKAAIENPSPVTVPENVDRVVTALATILENTALKSKEDTKAQKEVITTLFTAHVKPAQSPVGSTPTPIPQQQPLVTTPQQPEQKTQAERPVVSTTEKVQQLPVPKKHMTRSRVQKPDITPQITSQATSKKAQKVSKAIPKKYVDKPTSTAAMSSKKPQDPSKTKLPQLTVEQKLVQPKERQKPLRTTSTVPKEKITGPSLFKDIWRSPSYIDPKFIDKLIDCNVLQDNDYLLTIGRSNTGGYRAELQVWRVKKVDNEIEREFKHIPLLTGAKGDYIHVDTIGSDPPKITIKEIHLAIKEVDPNAPSLEEIESRLKEFVSYSNGKINITDLSVALKKVVPDSKMIYEIKYRLEKPKPRSDGEITIKELYLGMKGVVVHLPPLEVFEKKVNELQLCSNGKIEIKNLREVIKNTVQESISIDEVENHLERVGLLKVEIKAINSAIGHVPNSPSLEAIEAHLETLGLRSIREWYTIPKEWTVYVPPQETSEI